MLVLMFPRELLRFAPRELHAVSARRIRGNAGTGALVSAILTNLRNAMDIDTGPTSPVLEDAALDLLTAALASQVPTGTTPQEPALLQGAKSFIEADLDDIALDTALVASRHHVSVRSL